MHATCTSPEPDQSQSMPPPPFPHSTFGRSILILSLHLRLRLPCDFHKKIYISPALTVPPLFQVTSCTSNKFYLYFANSLATVISKPDLHRPLTFQVPNPMFLFHCLGCTKGSVQNRGARNAFETRPVFRVRSCRQFAQPPSWRPPLVGCLGLLIQYISSYPPYWRPFFLPQPESGLCGGDTKLPSWRTTPCRLSATAYSIY